MNKLINERESVIKEKSFLITTLEQEKDHIHNENSKLNTLING